MRYYLLELQKLYFWIQFTYLTICRSCVTCYLSLFCYLSNFGRSRRAHPYFSIVTGDRLPFTLCSIDQAWVQMPYILAKYFFFLLFYEHTMPMSRLLTKQGWSIKQCIKIGQKRTFSPGTLFLTRKIPSGYDWPILPARVANQNKGIVSYCPLADSAIQ